jgi:hypothetical protein
MKEILIYGCSPCHNNLKIQIISIFTKLNFTEDPNICLFHFILASCQWDSSRLLII